MIENYEEYVKDLIKQAEENLWKNYYSILSSLFSIVLPSGALPSAVDGNFRFVK